MINDSGPHCPICGMFEMPNDHHCPKTVFASIDAANTRALKSEGFGGEDHEYDYEFWRNEGARLLEGLQQMEDAYKD